MFTTPIKKSIFSMPGRLTGIKIGPFATPQIFRFLYCKKHSKKSSFYAHTLEWRLLLANNVRTEKNIMKIVLL